METGHQAFQDLEKFAACACAHFLTYGLRLKEREVYEFAALDLEIFSIKHWKNMPAG